MRGLALLSLACLGCSTPSIQDHEVLRDSYWKTCRDGGPLTVQAASPMLLDYMTAFSREYDYPGDPKAIDPSSEELRTVEAALKEIPKEVLELAGGRFCGVFLARDLGVMAVGENTVDPSGKPIGGFIFIDSGRLGKTANEWRTEHENLFFEVSKGKLEGVIASKGKDTRIAALRWILIHELGHVIRGLRRDGDFSAISWLKKDRAFVSKLESSMPFRTRLRNVRVGSKLFPEKDFLPIYRELEKTDFPTLYAATSPDEDFSESLAAYVNTAIFGEPVSMRYRVDGNVEKMFKSCFEKKSCPKKVEFLKALLKR